MQSDLLVVARDSLAVLAGVSLNVDLSPTTPPSVAQATDFFALLRSNLNAAALHAAMGHEGPRFRDCSCPPCLDAAQLVPELEGSEPGAADAELNTILDQVLAELETSLLKAAWSGRGPWA